MSCCRAERLLLAPVSLSSKSISLPPALPADRRAEADLFGLDGYVPTSAVAEVELSPHDVFVQIDAEAYQMPYGAFRGWMDSNRSLAKIVQRSMEAFAIQLSYTAASNAVHNVNERLARWLLMCRTA